MHWLTNVSTLKDINVSLVTKLTTPGNRNNRTAGAYNAPNINFENLLTASLRQIYSEDVHLKKGTASLPVPVFDPMDNLALDNEAKFREGVKTVLKHEGSRLWQPPRIYFPILALAFSIAP